ncbi:membrane copper amine oxidase [Eremomyces bilateralis CBS 781.70]|uniref:Amine oxidase n=1 Tax=Eremomyces bilateralis CBS 781.70 TaxID=1392243 RepID=A0A6G1G317_9PEZI|nr:membrane copper amine oxidase [Eremomyces bilateralis CBS 781.70]KAF1812382.1 membrane copper amine oxidase [Eremomyces bilateralis CBS 781.70]
MALFKVFGANWLAALVVLLFAVGTVVSMPNSLPKLEKVPHGYAKNWLYSRGGKPRNETKPVNAESCVAPVVQTITAPKENIFAGLSDVEAASVVAFLFDQKTLNLTTSDEAGSWDNTITLVELLQPNKTAALSYLDGNGTPPVRYAHVMLNCRSTEEPYYQDLTVGPLPISNGTTTIAALEYPYTRKTEGKVRNLDADADEALYADWLYVIAAEIQDITLDWFGGVAVGEDNDTLSVWGIDPLWQDDGIIRWDQFWNTPTGDFDSGTLLPTGLYFGSNVTGRDASQWELLGWYYNGIYYKTTEDFKAAYASPDFVKHNPNVDGDWAWTDHLGSSPEQDVIAPPVSVAPSGSRYAVDVPQKYVKWMDFEFYISFNRDLAMQLHDIKYKGERVLYELGLQEALAHYAGQDPTQSGTAYLDSFYGFGPYSFELVAGYDCPSHATYLDTQFYTGETTHTHKNSICLFEKEAQHAMSRHSTGSYVTVNKNIYFTVRNICTIGNYDYMFSYEFYMDGSMKVEVRASGYIQSAFFANNDDYGYQIHDSLSGSMHDHVLNFKADFDVLGTSNTLTKTALVPTTETYPWSMGKSRNTMKLNKTRVVSEDESKLFWDHNSQTQYQIVNLDKPNKYGESRGWRISPSEGTAHLTVENSSNLQNAANWAKYDFAVTRRKDTEPRAAHAYNSQDVANPPVDFDDFFDGESLEQEDLVVWFNLGMHHVPHTGDLPNTVMTNAHSSVQFSPLNYLMGDAGRESVNMVRVQYGEGEPSDVVTFGGQEPQCLVDMATLQPDLTTYIGDVVIRKFPFDPNNPYFETGSI